MGPVRPIMDVSRTFGRQSVTWRATSVRGDMYYLKRHQHRHHYKAEAIAFEQWVPSLRTAEWWAAPRIVGKSEQLGGLGHDGASRKRF